MVLILSASRTLGATQAMVTSWLIWSMEPLTNFKAIAFMTMNSTWSRGIPHTFDSFYKVTTLLFLGKLKASSRKAINRIFCWSLAELFFKISWVRADLHGWDWPARSEQYLLCWISRWVRRAKSYDCSWVQLTAVVREVQRSCKSHQTPIRRLPYQRANSGVLVLQFIGAGCRRDTGGQMCRIVCISPWQHSTYSRVGSRRRRDNYPHLCDSRQRFWLWPLSL